VAIEDAIAALPEYWDDVVTRLGAEGSRELRDLVGEIGGPGHTRAVSRLADLLVERLPKDHPVRRALIAGDLYAAATLDWAEITEMLQAKAEGMLTGELRPGELILRSVTERLLAAPALAEDEVRQRGADPSDPGLIGLDRPGGGRQWPEFQFAPGRGPWPVVREVNRLLEAAAFPLGAADWWLSRNGWLGRPPSELIGEVPDDHLVQAARAIRSEV
jgi:hypothetical protein